MMKQNAIGWFDIYVNDMDRADSSVIMKGFVTDMECYGAGGALVKREGAGPVTGGTIVYFGVAICLA